jgi:hypothetical protein
MAQTGDWELGLEQFNPYGVIQDNDDNPNFPWEKDRTFDYSLSFDPTASEKIQFTQRWGADSSEQITVGGTVEGNIGALLFITKARGAENSFEMAGISITVKSTGETFEYSAFDAGPTNTWEIASLLVTGLPDLMEGFEVKGKVHPFWVGDPPSRDYMGYHIKAIAQPVPEPTTMLLVGSGLAGLATFRRRFRKR